VAWTPVQVAVAVRTLIVCLVFVLVLLNRDRTEALIWFPVVAGLAVIGGLRPWPGLTGRLIGIAESVGAVVAVLESGAGNSPLFPYLLVPAFTRALFVGVSGALIPSGFAALALVAGGLITRPGDPYPANSAQWVVLAVAAGLAATWIRTLLVPNPRSPEEVDTSYAAAYRLLAQLRPVARQLSVGLDPVTIGEGLLQSLRTVFAFDYGSVLVRTGAGRLVPLAHTGTQRSEWDVDVSAEGPFADAWLTQRPQMQHRRLSGDDGCSLVVPLVIGLRTFGLVGLETERRDVETVDTAQIVQLVEEASLRLETALLFDEVRGVATAEERRRLAREIHDGIAQELSYLGYFVDSLGAEAASLGQSTLRDQLKQLRGEITRIVSELRLSIFDLRSDVETHGGLGAALSEYVQSIGRQSGLIVHMSLAEAAKRLPAETEAELLRIAQEAITNARKHAEAHNLWVRLEIDPPAALLRIEDDGRGLRPGRDDSFGMAIMRERAGRLRTDVTVEARQPQGTTVEVRLGGGDRATLPATAPQPQQEDLEELPRG
jgi:signal transduction histidine kinase